MTSFIRHLSAFVAALLLCASLFCTTAAAQGGPETNPYGTGAGGQVLLTNSGFGLGGYYQRALSGSASLVVEAGLRTAKHESEGTFVDYFGRRTTPGKANFMLMMPVRLGVQHRLFQSQVEDNFRPYLQLSGGPTVGWEYAYFRDCNGSNRFEPNDPVDCDDDGETDDQESTYDVFSGLPHGSFRFGVNGLLAIGAHFGESTRTMQGIRIGYTLHYFPAGVQLLQPPPGQEEPDLEHFFGSPIITIVFGRIL